MPIQSDNHRTHPLMRRVRHFLRSRRGNIAVMTALLFVPLVAIMGVATQGGSWFLEQRAMQNAADSAVIAAATNGGNGGSDYVTEAKAMAASYGFTDGSNNVTVTVPAPANYAPASCVSSPCYSVTIASVAPLYLLQVLGYKGNAKTSGGSPGQAIDAGALATTLSVNGPICLIGLGSSGSTIDASGIASSTLGCNIFSNSDSPLCNGHPLTTGWSDSVNDPQSKTQKSCGQNAKSGTAQQHGKLSTLADPYQPALTNNPPTNPCSKYYPDSSALWAGNGGLAITGDPSWDGSTKTSCGDVKLTGPVTLTQSSTVLVIENGQLDLNGQSITTTGNGGLTIIFTSPNPSSAAYTSGGTPSNFIGGNGTLSIAAPTSGTWSGLAIIQNKNLPLQSATYTGGTPTFDISGVVDAPASSWTVHGNISSGCQGGFICKEAANGAACFTLVVHDLTITGTGNLFYTDPQSQCAKAGVTQVLEPAGVIGKLVY